MTVIIGFVATVQADSRTLKAGAAMRIVNPHKPAVPIGHGGTTAYSDVHADLRVQAMVIEDEDGNRLAWMGWDTCKIHSQMVNRVKKIVQKRYRLDPNALCINASHTHSAPALIEQHAMAPEYFDAEYAEFVIDQAVKAVADAISRLVPVKLRYCEYMCTSVGINRRNPPDFKPLFKPNLKGPVDHSIQIVAAESATDGKLVAIAVKYACHPVTVGPTGLGSDFPGFMRKFIEKRHPGAVAIFLQGCAGDVRTQMINNDATTFIGGRASDFSTKIDASASKFIGEAMQDKAERFGRDLGMAVEWALSKPGTPITGPIDVDYAVIELPLSKLTRNEYLEVSKEPGRRGAWGKKFLAKLDRGEPLPTTQPYQIQVFSLGADSKTPFVLVALQGEPFTEYGFNIREMLQPANTIVIGYSNNMVTYVPTAQAISQGGYEPNAYKHGKLLPGGYSAAAEQMILKTAAKLARPKAAAHK